MSSIFPVGPDGLVDLEAVAKDCYEKLPGYRERFMEALDAIDREERARARKHLTLE